MQRRCEYPRCGRAFTAQRASARYCSSTCRGKASQDRARAAAAGSEVVQLPTLVQPATEGLRATVERELRDAKRLDSYGGQLALRLADRIEHSAVDTGSAVAGLARELDRLMVGLLGDAPRESDALDEIQAQVVQLRTQRRA